MKVHRVISSTTTLAVCDLGLQSDLPVRLVRGGAEPGHMGVEGGTSFRTRDPVARLGAGDGAADQVGPGPRGGELQPSPLERT